ncbi:MAG: FimV/HubP family polar landmark protein [Wenzhouxiangellaceae bacterium]|nr:FimV/HubP family polar landmark protein [Wenzhouxiangellaceae bacterium]
MALLLAVCMPMAAQALGLGEARVDSFLNQPLDARLRLLETSAEELDSLTVRMASPADFERLGLMSTSLALDIDVTIDRSQTPPIVRLRSDRPVSDPIVQLLVDARWASGRVLREYTLFLDPPTIDLAPPRAAQAQPSQAREREVPAAVETTRPAQAEPAPRRAQSEPQPDRQPERRPQSQSVRVASAGSYGPIAGGETLWGIARDNRPAADIGMNQMMLAIVELNPNAFRNGNINQLLRGAELELPDAETVRAIDRAAAAAAVAAQNRAFNQRLASDVPMVSDAARSQAPDPDASTEARRQQSPEPSDGTIDHRLALVPPTEQEGGSGLSGDENEVGRLRQQLARTEEELYAARQEAEEFQARLSDLEALVRENPQGIGVRDADLAGLEQTLRAAREATAGDADGSMRSEVSGELDEYLERFEQAAAVGSSSPDMTIGAASDSTSMASDTANAAPMTAAEEPVEPLPAAEIAPPVTQVGNGSSDSLLRQPAFLVSVGLLALLLLIAGVWRSVARSRKGSVERAEPRVTASSPAAPPRQATDPVAQARQAVLSKPDDLAAHLALLHTLSARADENEFSSALEDMFEHVQHGDEPEWHEALELAGRIVPGHGLVKGSADWTADASRDSVLSAEPRSEIDDDSEVDDLMSRLDADLDETGDDSDWLDQQDDEDATDTTPRLRDTEERSDTLGKGDQEAPAQASDRLSDEPVDFDAWLDEDADHPVDEELPTDQPAADDRVADEPFSDELPSSPEPSEQVSDDLVLDWPEFGDSDQERAARAVDESAPPADQDRGAEEDIFGPSDDDVDVKLDLARAYLSWNSTDSARTLLEEVVREGNESQSEQARQLLDEL